MTWSHPRGLHPLLALSQAARSPGQLFVDAPPVVWQSHDLAGFESTAIAAAGADCDLIVMDHPHLGDAVRTEAIVPIEEVMPRGWEPPQFVGAALDSYRYAGRLWALPIDAACMVSACQATCPERPTDWGEARRLMAKVPSGLPARGPHLLLAFLAICHGIAGGLRPDVEGLVEPDVGQEAARLLSTVISTSDPEVLDLDPIQTFDRMATGRGPAYVPLAFGYAGYALGRRHPIAFFDAPQGASGVHGSVLGGAGVAVTRHGQVRARDVAAHVAQLISPAAQIDVVADFGGQPALSLAWQGDSLAGRGHEFYRDTRATQLGAWRRPRHPRWIQFQEVGSHLLRVELRSGTPAHDLVETLNGCYRAYRERLPFDGRG